MQAGINQLRNGISIEMDGEIFTVVGFEHVKPGKGGAFVRTRLKNLKLGTMHDRTFRPNEKVKIAYLEKKNIQFLYSSKDIYEFMDQKTYEQTSLHKSQLGEVTDYLKENMEITAIVYKNQIIALEPPVFVELKIVSTEPGIRGDTSKSGTKPAKTESGMVILVPLFINQGDIIRVDTRTKEYAGRV